MADIRLAKPAAGTTQTIPSAPDGRFIFDFPAYARRPDGSIPTLGKPRNQYFHQPNNFS